MAEKDDKFIKLMKSAKAKLDRSDFEGAIADYTAAINLNPADKNQLAEGYNSRGFAKDNLGRREEAIEDYDEAIRLNPEFAAAWNNRGLAKSQLGHHEEAIANLDEAIRLDSENATAWYNRGFAKDNLGRHEETIADLDEVIRLNPENARAWHNRGLAKNKLDRHKEAIADFDEAIRLDPEYAFAWNNRGSAKNKLDRHKEAIADFDEVIRLDPKSAATWHNRGVAKANLGDYRGAIADLDEAIRLDPEFAPALNNLAAIKAEKAGRDAVEERIGSLKTGTEEAENQARKYEWIERRNRFATYLLMPVLIGTISFLVVVLIVPNLPSEHFSKLLSEYFPELLPRYSLELPPECSPKLKPECPPKLKPIGIKNLFYLLPLITIIIVMTSPLVWLIHLLLAAANKAELMKTEYRHLAYVEKIMFFYFAKDTTNESKKIKTDYITITMTNSPADKLLIFQNKVSEPSPISVQNMAEKAVSKVSDKSSI